MTAEREWLLYSTRVVDDAGQPATKLQLRDTEVMQSIIVADAEVGPDRTLVSVARERLQIPPKDDVQIAAET